MNCFEVIQGKSRQYLTQADTQIFVERLLEGTDHQSDAEQMVSKLPMFQGMELINADTQAIIKIYNAGPLQ